jgi:hypothetical protein
MRIRVGVFIISALAAWAVSVPAAKAAETEPARFDVVERTVLYLDRGFVGRPVVLDLFGNRVRVSWDEGDLAAPTILMVERERTASTTLDGVTLGEETVHLTWADPNNLSERGVRVEIPGECVPGAWTDCAAFRLDGTSWTKLADSRVAGHARVRVGSVQAAYMRSGSASWYAYKNCRCAASPDFPKGTRVRVTSQLTGKTTVVRINDWGPERDKFPERVIDLDAVAFKEFAPLGAGVIRVAVEPIGPDDPDYVLADSMPSAGTASPPVSTVAVSTAPAPVPKPSTTTPDPTWNY